MWVVDDKQVRALTRNSTAHTDGEVVAALGGIPATRRLGVCLQLQIREDLVVLVGINEISNFTAKAHGKFRRVGALDNFFTGKPP